VAGASSGFLEIGRVLPYWVFHENTGFLFSSAFESNDDGCQGQNEKAAHYGRWSAQARLDARFLQRNRSNLILSGFTVCGVWIYIIAFVAKLRRGVQPVRYLSPNARMISRRRRNEPSVTANQGDLGLGQAGRRTWLCGQRV